MKGLFIDMNGPTYRLAGVVKTKSDKPEDFSGPLDVILLLLSKNKIEIRDIQISLILEQYLQYLAEMKKMDLEIASEFIAMASQLLYIKTRMLLAIKDEEPLSEMELLMQSLEERAREEYYSIVKKTAKELGESVDYDHVYMVKPQEPLPEDRNYKYSHGKGDLISAMLAVMDRGEQRLAPPASAFDGIVGREPYPVDIKSGELLNKLILKGVAKFKSLFMGSKSKSEVVATFLAVLELCKARLVHITGIGAECSVTYAGSPTEDDANGD